MIKAYINNEEIVAGQDFTIKEEIKSCSSTILNKCYPKSWEDTKDYTNQFYMPLDYSNCKIYNNEELIFNGLVKNTGTISLNPRMPKYCSVQILDFKTLLSEGETLDFVIYDKTILEALNMIIAKILPYGFALGNIEIETDQVIGTYSTNNKTAYDVFNYIADITGSLWFTRRINDQITAIDFYTPENLPKANDIEYTEEWFNENEIIDITYSMSTNDYRNKQVVFSNEVVADVETDQYFTTDGINKEYTLDYNVGEIISVKYNNVEKIVLSKKEYELGYECDFYYEENKLYKTILVQEGNLIEIKYKGIVSGRRISQNTSDINRIQEQLNRKSIISRYETRADVIDGDELQAISDTYIKYKGTADINLTIKSTKDILNVGQLVFFDAPLNNLAKNYLVKSKEIKYIANINKIFYTYTLSSSLNTEKAINWFDNQRSKKQGNISEDQYIQRNVDLDSESNVEFYDYEEEDISDYTVLDFAIESGLL